MEHFNLVGMMLGECQDDNKDNLDDRDDYGTIKMVKRIMTMSTTR
jgi:hypothetical protein